MQLPPKQFWHRSVTVRQKVGIGLLLLLLVLSALYRPYIGGVLLIWTCLCLLFFFVPQSEAEKKEEEEPPEKPIALDRRGLPEMPFAYLQVSQAGEIRYANALFSKSFSREEQQSLPVASLLENVSKSPQSTQLGERSFDVYLHRQAESRDRRGRKERLITLCFVESTGLLTRMEKLEAERTVAGLIFWDNYEEVTDTLDAGSLPILTALIDRKLNAVAVMVGGILRKYEKDRYLFLLSRRGLSLLQEKKFAIQSEMRELRAGEHIPVTLSIGFGISDENLEDSLKSAKSALDLALGRGGDQVLIKEGEKYLFYGGKSGEISHNARIRARIKADALWELLGEVSEVLVMGHRQADLDSLGAAIGVYAIARAMHKPCYIVLSSVSPGVRRLYERIEEQEEYEALFVEGEEAQTILTDKTLLVVVDTHIPSLADTPELLSLAKKIVVLDHHRQSTDFIDNAVLVYHEPYASSTAELVTEMIQYFGEKVRVSPLEADALLSGITVDTKNFCVKTGAITFEAAAFLKRRGADSIRVRKLFQSDMVAYQAKAAAVKDAVVFAGNMAISDCLADTEDGILTAAQAADDLLNVMGIEASFVCCQVAGTSYISARSLDSVNVQRIMERLGGGGHLTVAAAQLLDTPLPVAKTRLKAAIQEYLKEEK